MMVECSTRIEANGYARAKEAGSCTRNGMTVVRLDEHDPERVIASTVEMEREFGLPTGCGLARSVAARALPQPAR